MSPYALSPLISAAGSPTPLTWKLLGAAAAQHSYALRVYHALSNVTLYAATVVSPHPRAVVPPLSGAPRTGLVLSLSVRASPGGVWSAAVEAPFFLGPGPRLRDWGGSEWLCTGVGSTDARATMLRAEGALPGGRGAVASASLWAVGVGQYALALNGAPVGGATNAPGWTRWDARVLYGSFDVAPLLPAPGGRFALSAVLGNGFYNVPLPPNKRYTKFTAPPWGPRALLARLQVEFTDGTSFTFDTEPASGAWVATDGGPISFTHQYAGEDYNASLEEPDWALPGWAPANPLVAWAPAANCSGAAPRGALLPQAHEAVGVAEVLPAVSLNGSALPGVTLVDVGRNFAGFPELTVAGVPAGATVRVWPSETVEAGAINQASGGTPTFLQVFTAPGGAPNATVNVTVRPRFFTYGWRWLAVEVLPGGGPQPPPGPAPPPAPPFNGTIAGASLIASWGLNCNPAVTGDLTAAVSAACGGKAWCDFAVCAGAAPPCIPDPAPNCAKNFTSSFACSGDPAGAPRRAAGLPPEAAYGPPARLSCEAFPPAPPAPPTPPAVGAAAGLFTRALVPRVGTWSSSNEWVNRIHNITVEAIEANLQHVLTDCPHRERLGWLEVSHLMAPSIAFNFDISRLWRKISLDTVDSQLADGMVPDIAPEYTVFSGGFRDSPEWGSALPLNPYWLHVISPPAQLSS